MLILLAMIQNYERDGYNEFNQRLNVEAYPLLELSVPHMDAGFWVCFLETGDSESSGSHRSASGLKSTVKHSLGDN